MDNPEALLDILTIQSMRERFHSPTTATTTTATTINTVIPHNNNNNNHKHNSTNHNSNNNHSHSHSISHQPLDVDSPTTTITSTISTTNNSTTTTTLKDFFSNQLTVDQDDLEKFVRDFSIDDSISDCFAGTEDESDASQSSLLSMTSRPGKVAVNAKVPPDRKIKGNRPSAFKDISPTLYKRQANRNGLHDNPGTTPQSSPCATGSAIAHSGKTKTAEVRESRIDSELGSKKIRVTGSPEFAPTEPDLIRLATDNKAGSLFHPSRTTTKQSGLSDCNVSSHIILDNSTSKELYNTDKRSNCFQRNDLHSSNDNSGVKKYFSKESDCAIKSDQNNLSNYTKKKKTGTNKNLDDRLLISNKGNSTDNSKGVTKFSLKWMLDKTSTFKKNTHRTNCFNRKDDEKDHSDPEKGHSGVVSEDEFIEVDEGSDNVGFSLDVCSSDSNTGTGNDSSKPEAFQYSPSGTPLPLSSSSVLPDDPLLQTSHGLARNKGRGQFERFTKTSQNSQTYVKSGDAVSEDYERYNEHSLSHMIGVSHHYKAQQGLGDNDDVTLRGRGKQTDSLNLHANNDVTFNGYERRGEQSSLAPSAQHLGHKTNNILNNSQSPQFSAIDFTKNGSNGTMGDLRVNSLAVNNEDQQYSQHHKKLDTRQSLTSQVLDSDTSTPHRNQIIIHASNDGSKTWNDFNDSHKGVIEVVNGHLLTSPWTQQSCPDKTTHGTSSDDTSCSVMSHPNRGIIQYVVDGDVNTLKQVLLSNPPSPNNTHDMPSETQLKADIFYVAIQNDKPECLATLLKTLPPASVSTPLLTDDVIQDLFTLCARQGRARCLGVLIQYFGSARLESVVDIEGNTLLHLAASQDDPEVVLLLVSNGINVNSKNSSGKTPLNLCFSRSLSCRNEKSSPPPPPPLQLPSKTVPQGGDGGGGGGSVDVGVLNPIGCVDADAEARNPSGFGDFDGGSHNAVQQVLLMCTVIEQLSRCLQEFWLGKRSSPKTEKPLNIDYDACAYSHVMSKVTDALKTTRFDDVDWKSLFLPPASVVDDQQRMTPQKHHRHGAQQQQQQQQPQTEHHHPHHLQQQQQHHIPLPPPPPNYHHNNNNHQHHSHHHHQPEDQYYHSHPHPHQLQSPLHLPPLSSSHQPPMMDAPRSRTAFRPVVKDAVITPTTKSVSGQENNKPNNNNTTIGTNNDMPNTNNNTLTTPPTNILKPEMTSNQIANDPGPGHSPASSESDHLYEVICPEIPTSFCIPADVLYHVTNPTTQRSRNDNNTHTPYDTSSLHKSYDTSHTNSKHPTPSSNPQTHTNSTTHNSPPQHPTQNGHFSAKSHSHSPNNYSEKNQTGHKNSDENIDDKISHKPLTERSFSSNSSGGKSSRNSEIQSGKKDTFSNTDKNRNNNNNNNSNNNNSDDNNSTDSSNDNHNDNASTVLTLGASTTTWGTESECHSSSSSVRRYSDKVRARGPLHHHHHQYTGYQDNHHSSRVSSSHSSRHENNNNSHQPHVINSRVPPSETNNNNTTNANSKHNSSTTHQNETALTQSQSNSSHGHYKRKLRKKRSLSRKRADNSESSSKSSSNKDVHRKHYNCNLETEDSCSTLTSVTNDILTSTDTVVSGLQADRVGKVHDLDSFYTSTSGTLTGSSGKDKEEQRRLQSLKCERCNKDGQQSHNHAQRRPSNQNGYPAGRSRSASRHRRSSRDRSYAARGRRSKSCGSRLSQYCRECHYHHYDDDDDNDDDDDDDDEYEREAVKLDLGNENLPDEMLRVQRLERHLESVQRAHQPKPDVLETVVTGTGERLTSRDPLPDVSRHHHVNIGEAYPFSSATGSVRPPQVPPKPSVNLTQKTKSKALKFKPRSRLFNHERAAGVAPIGKPREMTESEFEEMYDRRNDPTVRQRMEMDRDVAWDDVSFTESEDTDFTDTDHVV